MAGEGKPHDPAPLCSLRSVWPAYSRFRQPAVAPCKAQRSRTPEPHAPESAWGQTPTATAACPAADAAPQSWFDWLSRLFSGLSAPRPPEPGSHEADLEEIRLSALLEQERRKPEGERDEELVHRLTVDWRRTQLENARVRRGECCGGKARR